MSWNSLIVECVWFLVGWLAWVGFWLMNNFFTKCETKTLCRESRVYYGSWKLNKTMCDWCVVRSGACFGQRWKPVCDTAPLFGLDWYPASVAATEIFSTLIRLFTPNSVAAAFQLEPIAEKLSRLSFLFVFVEIKIQINWVGRSTRFNKFTRELVW